MGEAGLRFLLVALGGAAGATFRYTLNIAALALLGPRFPWGTLAANAVGCFLAGIALVFFTEREVLSTHHRLLLITGFLGGLTTFSAFALDTLTLSRERELGMASLNIGLNMLVGLGGVWLGWALARSLWA